MAERTHLSIGEVLSLLRDEFPDVTISKIRFLESQGLVDPERTPSGYRKFYDHDVERLRWILRQQRENFLPLKIIRGRLTEQGEELDDGVAGDADGTAAGSDEPGLESATLGRQATIEAASSSHPAAATRARSPLGNSAPAAVPSTGATGPSTRGQGPEAGERAVAGAAGPPPGRSANPAGGGSAGAPVAPPAAGEGAAPAPAPAPRPAPGAGPSGVARAASAAGAVSGRGGPGTDAGPRQAGRGRAGAAGAPQVALGEEAETFSAEELAEACGGTVAMVTDLQQYGLITARVVVGGTAYFDAPALNVARAAAGFSRHGVEARHLRAWRNAADREAGIFEQVIVPLLRQRNPEARRQAAATLAELATLGGDLRKALVDQALRQIR
jgi:DNA-binding transcriptional MerR regulator